MRHKLSFIYLFISSLGALLSCSPIAEDERLIFVEPADARRAVLIEDFTGQRCSNCPNAAAQIAAIRAAYPEGTIVAVGVHGGPMAFAGNARNIGLSTPLGDEYVEHWGCANTLPKGLVNRVGQPSNPEQWTAQVAQAVAAEPVLQLEASVRLDTLEVDGAAAVTAHIAIDALGLRDVEGKLQVWLTESGITAMQSMPDGTTNREYVHDHVLRAAVNGSWGDTFSITKGQARQLTFGYTLDAAWKASNMAVVAFVYNEQGVQQVCEASLP